MKVYTYSEARQALASVLNRARREGAVRIRWRDGQTFVIKPETPTASPIDVKDVDLDVTTDEIVAFVREGRCGR
jgi:uncharacterized protein (DUF362 family)